MEAVRRRAAVQSQERLQEAEIAESAPEPIQYAYWRTDKAKEDGFSHELISYDAAKILDKTDIDTLDVQPYPEINTILKAIRRNVHRTPAADFMGTRVGTEYQWISWKDALEKAECFSHGCKELGLVPENEGEGDGKKWRFMGI